MTKVTDTPVPIAWEEAGDGPPLLLVMGLGYGRWGWEPLIPLLADEFRVVTFDNRGIGESGHPEGPYTANMMAEDCRSVLNAAGVERAHVAGSSAGGMIAQELAIESPETVDRLILMSTTPGGDESYPMPSVTTELLAQVEQMAPEEALRRLVENALSPDAPEEAVDRIMHHRLDKPQSPEGWQAQAAAGIGYDGSGRARRIAAPTLILHGESDNVVDTRNADVLHHLIPNSRVELVPGGHLFFWESPRQAAELMTSFLSGDGR
ncbi:MAG: alpha/beta fold hydrolase [Actinomycetota bacterium]